MHLREVLADVHRASFDHILRLWHSDSLKFNASLLLDLFNQHLGLTRIERNTSSTGSGSGSSTASMDVSLSLLGWLNLNDKVDIWDVKTTRSNVSSDEHAELSFLEPLHGHLTLVLSDVSMHDLDVLLDFIREQK